MVENRLSDMAKEANLMFRSARKSHGEFIEGDVAQHKLDSIVDPDPDFSPNHIASPTWGIDVFAKGIIQDYGFVAEASGMIEAILQMAENTKASIGREIVETAKQYKELKFAPGTDPTVVAKDDSEKAIILEAACLMGYTVSEGEDGSCKAFPQRRTSVSHVEQTIANRVNVGIKNLIEDYSKPPMRRPVIRMIVAMAQTMADSLRNPAK